MCDVDYRNAYLGFCGVFEVVGWCWELILDEYGLGFVLNDESLITLCQRVRLQLGRTSFFIILVSVNGPSTRNELAPRSYPAGTQRGGSLTPCGLRIKSAMTSVINLLGFSDCSIIAS